MRPWRYLAYTAEGAKRRGIVLADDEADASARLATQGLMVAELHSEGVVRPSLFCYERRINRDMLAVFTRQMAVLLDAGLTAETALAAVQKAAVSPRVERLVARTRASLLEGASMTDALRASGSGIPAWYLTALGAGERAGELPAVYTTLADHLENDVGERTAVASALLYPAFVIVVALIVCGVLMTTVAPEIAALFEGSGQPLPPLTSAVMAATEAIIAARWSFGAAILVLSLVAVMAARIPAWRDRRDRLSLRLPLIGRLRRMGQAAQYLRTLAVVIAARLPLIEALDFAAQVLDIERYRGQAEAATEALRRGSSLKQAMSGIEFLHPVSRQLIEAGEASARLGPMSERAAVLAENWMRTERKRMTAVLEPLAMVFVGLAVLTIVMAVLLPIFDMHGIVQL